jgi:hypothetical protein
MQIVFEVLGEAKAQINTECFYVITKHVVKSLVSLTNLLQHPLFSLMIRIV